MRRLHYACILGIGLFLLACSSGDNQGGKDAAVAPPPVIGKDAAPPTPSGNKDAPIACPFGGITYFPGTSFTLNCTTFTCQPDGYFATAPACLDAAVPLPDAPVPFPDAAKPLGSAETAGAIDMLADAGMGSEAPARYDAFQVDSTDAPNDPSAAGLDVSTDRSDSSDDSVGDAPSDSADAADAPIICSVDETKCNGVCVSLTTDKNNCGSCGRVCPADSTCTTIATAAGTTTSCICADSKLTACGAKCTSLLTDNANCGACGKACPVGGSCVADGASASCQCPSGQSTVCNNVCVNLQSDFSNCGTCGKYCQFGDICSNGYCLCPSLEMRCNGYGTSCISVATDQNCGSCGHACQSGAHCSTTQYSATSWGSSCKCTDPQMTACSTGCTNLATDSKNCGYCGTVCPSGMSCGLSFVPGEAADGKCLCDNPALTACGVDCVDTTSDPAHCGSCTACKGAGSQCIDSKCYGAYAMCVAKTTGCPWLIGASSMNYAGTYGHFNASPALSSLRTSLVAPSTMVMEYEYAASADTCWNIPKFIVSVGTQTQEFPFPGFVTVGAPCNVHSSATMNVPIPAGTTPDQISFELVVGDYIISILITSITFVVQ